MNMQLKVPVEKIPASGTRTYLKHGQRSIVLFNIESNFYAIEDSCPHQGASLWAGKLQGLLIQCCAHGMRFDLDSGYLNNSTAMRLTTYPVKEIAGQLCILLGAGQVHEIEGEAAQCSETNQPCLNKAQANAPRQHQHTKGQGGAQYA